MSLEIVIDNIKKSGMPLIVKPTAVAKSPTPVLLGGKGTTGLDTDKTIMKSYTKSTVIKFLETLDFNKYVPDIYDCEDRAFWGMAHVRRRFPGCPIGIATGISEYVPRKRHAVIILWYKEGKDYVFWDPLPERPPDKKEFKNLDEFHNINSIISFPIGSGKKDIAPLGKLALFGPSPSARASQRFDENVLVYPLFKDDNEGNPGIERYLEDGLYDKEGVFKCVDIDIKKDDGKGHKASNKRAFKYMWNDHDRALWDFVHVRRAYPGCSVGMAIGQPRDGQSSAVLMIWEEGDKSQSRYWEPKRTEDGKGRFVNDFDPYLIII